MTIHTHTFQRLQCFISLSVSLFFSKWNMYIWYCIESLTKLFRYVICDWKVCFDIPESNEKADKIEAKFERCVEMILRHAFNSYKLQWVSSLRPINFITLIDTRYYANSLYSLLLLNRLCTWCVMKTIKMCAQTFTSFTSLLITFLRDKNDFKTRQFLHTKSTRIYYRTAILVTFFFLFDREPDYRTDFPNLSQLSTVQVSQSNALCGVVSKPDSIGRIPIIERNTQIKTMLRCTLPRTRSELPRSRNKNPRSGSKTSESILRYFHTAHWYFAILRIIYQT